MSVKIKSIIKKQLNDMLTPVGLYLRLRDVYPNALLLESSDYNKRQNSYSYICLHPIASFKADRDHVEICYPSGLPVQHITGKVKIAEILRDFAMEFEVEGASADFITQGLFGYTTYDAIPTYHPIRFRHQPIDVPLVYYQYFRFVLVFNHFHNELFLVENLMEGQEPEMHHIEQLMGQENKSSFPFSTTGAVQSNFTDDEMLGVIQQGQEHCYRGNVFQVVLSRQFSQVFKGDEFNVYRALRSINPSPYLFYFDYGSYKVMGSSPEAQLVVAESKATIHPIAGTCRRSGIPEEDERLAEALINDPKETAEHVMLVDLARNDLSMSSDQVKVKRFKAIEMYSHVIHLVSQVEAALQPGVNAVEIFLNTFPAGTLSGAPKHRAMQIIDELENTSRGFYGGAVGIIGLDGSINQAIFIRSILSKRQTLYYQAGCGVVVKSVPEMELQEINNKVSAVQSAVAMAKNIGI